MGRQQAKWVRSFVASTRASAAGARYDHTESFEPVQFTQQSFIMLRALSQTRLCEQPADLTKLLYGRRTARIAPNRDMVTITYQVVCRAARWHSSPN